jgi:hypothetical protein
VVAFAVYAPALRGGFVSDDVLYVSQNPWVKSLDAASVRVLIDPAGPPARETQNWAPLHLLAHALQWQIHGDRVAAHHVTNVVVHTVVSVLLTALLAVSGVPRLAALVGGFVFLVHPANVEAVAWITQLKTTASTALAISALLAWWRSPWFGALLFAAALLFKPTAAFALPVVLLFAWAKTREQALPRSVVVGLVVWIACLGTYSVVQMPLLEGNRFVVEPVDPDPGVRARTMLAIFGRYLAMAATGAGTATFQDLPPARSWLDPWWIGGLVALVAIAARGALGFLRRRTEAAYWAWSVAAFVPVSQVIPFVYPIADRYLYTILPGLLGGVLLAAREWLLEPFARSSRPLRVAIGAAVVVLAGLFSIQSHQRAKLWRDSVFVHADSAQRFPDGLIAQVLRAQAAAREGDAEGTARALRAAAERGFDRYDQLLVQPFYDPVRDHPAFQAVVRDLARKWADHEADFTRPTQRELRGFAQARLALGEHAEAERLLGRALEVGGFEDDAVRRELEAVRARARLREGRVPAGR